MIKFSIQALLLILAFPVFSQQLSPGNNIERNRYGYIRGTQEEFLFKIYYEKVGGTDALINGKEYMPYYNRATLKPILFAGKSHTASVILNGRKYNNIALEYDTFTDEVVFTDNKRFIDNRMYQLALNKDLVDGFGLFFGQDSMNFRDLRSDSEQGFNLQDGFYEIAYEGNLKYIIRHQSAVHEKEGVDEYYYSPVNYVRIGGSYFRIRSSRGFVKLFGEKSESVRKFIRSNNVDIRKADKRQLVNVMKYCDSLIMPERLIK